MRYPTDAKWTDLMTRVMNLDFTPDPDAEHLCSPFRGTRTWKNCSWNVMLQQFECKLYFGTEVGQRTLCRSLVQEKAVRFTDCAIIYFWKYRKNRKAAAITDNYVNLTVARAQRELANNKPLVALLQALESHLIVEYGLKPVNVAPLVYSWREETKRCSTVISFLSQIVASTLPRMAAGKLKPAGYTATIADAINEVMPLLVEVRDFLSEVPNSPVEICHGETANLPTSYLPAEKEAKRIIAEQKAARDKAQAEAGTLTYADTKELNPHNPLEGAVALSEEEHNAVLIKLGIRKVSTNTSTTQ